MNVISIPARCDLQERRRGDGRAEVLRDRREGASLHPVAILLPAASKPWEEGTSNFQNASFVCEMQSSS